MAFYPGLYDNEMYRPDPWRTTWVPKHFPEHHYPFEHSRHAIHHAFSQMGHDFMQGWADHTMLCPRVDIKESKTAYYIDVELPGLDDDAKIKLRWISSRTLLVKAVIERKATPEDGIKATTEEKNETVSKPKEEVDDNNNSNKIDDNEEQVNKSAENKEKAVYLTLGERRLGPYGRAFGFAVDVDHEKTTARLCAGLLSLTIPKVEEGKNVPKVVSVENERDAK